MRECYFLYAIYIHSHILQHFILFVVASVQTMPPYLHQNILFAFILVSDDNDNIHTNKFIWFAFVLFCTIIHIYLTILIHLFFSLFADNELYSGTVADFSGSDPIIYRETLQTEQYDSLSLNGNYCIHIHTYRYILIMLYYYYLLNFSENILYMY